MRGLYIHRKHSSKTTLLAQVLTTVSIGSLDDMTYFDLVPILCVREIQGSWPAMSHPSIDVFGDNDMNPAIPLEQIEGCRFSSGVGSFDGPSAIGVGAQIEADLVAGIKDGYAHTPRDSLKQAATSHAFGERRTTWAGI